MRGAAWLLMMLGVGACEASPAVDAEAVRVQTSSAATVSPAAGPGPSGRPHPLGDAASWRRCGQLREKALAAPAAPGNPTFEATRAAMVGRVRGATVVWKREPRGQEDAAAAIGKLEAASRPLRAVRDLIYRHRNEPGQLRASFLREGYLYLRGVDAAVAAVQQLGLAQLFDAPTLFLVRDGVVHELRRHGRDYLHAGGALDGERAELLFADRVGQDREALERTPLAVDFSAAQEQLAFERIVIEHLSDEQMVATVRYGGPDGVWVSALFDIRGASARLECHQVAAEQADRVAAAYEQAQRARDVQAAIRAAAEAQVREQLPFDAPRGAGDPDDKYPLRARWMDAYSKSLRTFRFGERRYDVYDDQGRPRPPQVCIDFVYDTWERAAGTWYAPIGDADGGSTPAPQRLIGGLDMDAIGLDDRRRVSRFLDFAQAHSEKFDVWQVSEEDWVLYQQHQEFFAMLTKHADRFARGDMLVVRRPKLKKLALHHTMIVIEIDPLTGIPVLLAANAARPRIQTFEGVMQTSPKRYLKWRIRPRPEWLDAAVLGALGK